MNNCINDIPRPLLIASGTNTLKYVWSKDSQTEAQESLILLRRDFLHLLTLFFTAYVF